MKLKGQLLRRRAEQSKTTQDTPTPEQSDPRHRQTGHPGEQITFLDPSSGGGNRQRRGVIIV